MSSSAAPTPMLPGPVPLPYWRQLAQLAEERAKQGYFDDARRLIWAAREESGIFRTVKEE